MLFYYETAVDCGKENEYKSECICVSVIHMTKWMKRATRKLYGYSQGHVSRSVFV
jgi:hypothetical protein